MFQMLTCDERKSEETDKQEMIFLMYTCVRHLGETKFLAKRKLPSNIRVSSQPKNERPEEK